MYIWMTSKKYNKTSLAVQGENTEMVIISSIPPLLFFNH